MHENQAKKTKKKKFRRIQSMPFSWNPHESTQHVSTSFWGLPTFPSLPGASQPAATGATSAGAANPGANPGTNPGQGIDVKAEVARIEGNITLFYTGIVAGALGIGISSCLFVRSILKPAKGFHGGSSDGDMDSEDDESDEDSDES